MYHDYDASILIEAKNRNLTASTAAGYAKVLHVYLKWLKPSADSDITSESVRDFLLYKKETGTSPKTLRMYYSSLHFCFKYVLFADWDSSRIPMMKSDYNLPNVLSRDEVQQIIEAAPNLKYKAIFSTLYSSGLRISEVVNLRYCDISRKDMYIHVTESKGRIDRYTVLSKKNLDILTEYWFAYGKPREYLFPGNSKDHRICATVIQTTFQQIRKRLGIEKHVTVHTLRHSFATHLLEDHTDLRLIQALLGHHRSETTEHYIHMCNKVLLSVTSPYDLDDKKK